MRAETRQTLSQMKECLRSRGMDTSNSQEPQTESEDNPAPSCKNTKESILGDKPFVMPNGEIYKKRVRTVMTPAQSEALKRYFKLNSFPPAEVRAAISETLGMKPRTVQIWFQNQRQKMKQILQEEERAKKVCMLSPRDSEETTLHVLAHISWMVLGMGELL